MKSEGDKMALSVANRKLFIIAASTIVGALVMPHDAAVATIATKYIFPSVVAGMCFGLSIMTGINLAVEHRRAKQKAGE